MRRITSRTLAATVLALPLTVAACAEPPVAAVESGRLAEAAAVEAAAAEYAPEALAAVTAAREALDAELAAQEGRFALMRSYTRAGELAEAYRLAGDSAVAAATAALELAREESVSSIAQGWVTLERLPGLLSAAPRSRVNAQDAAAFRAEIPSLEATLRSAEIALAGARYLEARSLAAQVRESLDRIMAAVEPVPPAGS